MNKQHNTGLFTDLKISKKLLAILTKKGFTTPTPIQYQIIPGALEGKDVIGIAQTGTGKTLAFGIPMLQRIAKFKGQGLILVPTRELAMQVEKELKKIGSSFGFRSALIIGGVPQGRQVKALTAKPHIIIATPGRLDDLMKQGIFKLNKISIITLDEADRMLDIGFLPQIKAILKGAPKNHQTMLFSATMPKTISSLASQFMKIPLRIEIAPQGTAAKNVEQEIFIVPRDKKMRLLEKLLTQYKTDTILIFSRTKYGAKNIARKIRGMGHTATEIHSNRSQSQRKAALDGFTKGKFRVMVATDIAARGIDVKDISVVINYDLPDNSEDYVHRIGRTGRAGRSGKAISFATTAQKYDVKKIERLMKKSLPVLALPELPEQATGSQKPTHSNHKQPSRNKFTASSRPKQNKSYSTKKSHKSNSYKKRKRSTSTRDRRGKKDPEPIFKFGSF